MPLLRLTGPRDAPFPLDVLPASYRAATGPRMVSIPFAMKPSHPAGWNPPDSYASAKSIVGTSRPWARFLHQGIRDGVAKATFDVMPAVCTAGLVSKRDATSEISPAKLETRCHLRKVAGQTPNAFRPCLGLRPPLPAGSTAYYFNIDAGGLTVSSEYKPILLPSPNS